MVLVWDDGLIVRRKGGRDDGGRNGIERAGFMGRMVRYRWTSGCYDIPESDFQRFPGSWEKSDSSYLTGLLPGRPAYEMALTMLDYSDRTGGRSSGACAKGILEAAALAAVETKRAAWLTTRPTPDGCGNRTGGGPVRDAAS